MPGFALVEGSHFRIVFLCMDEPQFVHLFCLHGNLGSFQLVVLREGDTVNILVGAYFCIVFLCMDVPQFIHLFCLHGNLGSFQLVVLQEGDTVNILVGAFW